MVEKENEVVFAFVFLILLANISSMLKYYVLYFLCAMFSMCYIFYVLYVLCYTILLVSHIHIYPFFSSTSVDRQEKQT